MARYLIGFLIAIGLIILLIVLLFGGGGNKVPKTSKALTDYASTDAQVRLTIDGPINAAQDHQQVQITVNRFTASFQHVQGYDGSVVFAKDFTNTQNAYTVFLHALTHVGFTRGNNDPALADERGYCPLGNRFILELIDNGSDVERYWATSCGNPHTYEGNTSVTLSLFKAQIPGYDNLVQNIPL